MSKDVFLVSTVDYPSFKFICREHDLRKDQAIFVPVDGEMERKLILSKFRGMKPDRLIGLFSLNELRELTAPTIAIL